VPAQDASRLAAALEQAITQPALRAQYGRAARALVVSDFSMRRIAQETIALYDELSRDQP
jgi:glycosyltransferase involved in cell wall biosynthesis